MEDNSIQAEQLARALEQYEKLIFSICYRMLGDYFDAQDMTQETFLAAYLHREGAPEGYERQWLCRIAAKKASRREKPSEDQVLEYYAATVPPPEETVLENEVQEELRTACRELKPPYGLIAYEYYCRGRTAKEIAQAEGKKLKTVQTSIARARKKLQKVLER